MDQSVANGICINTNSKLLKCVRVHYELSVWYIICVVLFHENFTMQCATSKRSLTAVLYTGNCGVNVLRNRRNSSFTPTSCKFLNTILTISHITSSEELNNDFYEHFAVLLITELVLAYC